MDEQTKKLIQLINLDKSFNEICNILGITNRQLHYELLRLKQEGFNYDKKYYSDGSIIYQLNCNKNNCNTILTKNNSLSCIVISDLHLGNSNQRIDLINKVFDYCSKKNIHIIFCCGDIIDGDFSQSKQIIEDVNKQIEYFINCYPYDPNILTFAVAGNHDYRSKLLLNDDIINQVENYRHDVIIGGYGNSYINIKNDRLLLFHKIKGIDFNLNSSSVVLKGHHHCYTAFLQTNNILYIKVPSLSSLSNLIPSFLELNINFRNELIEWVNIKQFYFSNRIRKLNEDEFILSQDSKKDSSISSQPSNDKILIKRISQVEKFAKKFNI